MKRALLTAVVAATTAMGALFGMAAAPAATAQDLPFTIPQLRDPATGWYSGQVPTHIHGAPVPVPFSPDYLVGYISDRSAYEHGIYAEVNRLFPELRDRRPDVMDSNRAQVVAINNAAESDPARIHNAQIDASASSEELLFALSDALGEEFGTHFRTALTEGRLPKTQFLLGNGYLARTGGVASSTFVEKEMFKYPRPHVVMPDKIKRYNPPGKELYLTSKSFPSGHTNQATLMTSLLALSLIHI